MNLLLRILYPRPTLSQQYLKECFAGRWVVITGASSGIGLALAQQLMKAGANLYLIARREDVLIQLCDEARQQGCEAYYSATDLRDKEALSALTKDLQERLPQVDYLFCNAGKSILRPIREALDRLHDYDRTMDLNYRSAVALVLALIPSMQGEDAKNQAGRIIYTSSVSTLYPAAPGWSAYHASKMAANVWFETADAEYAKTGLRFKIAYMPLVHTPMSDVNPSYKTLPGYSADDAALILLRLSQSRNSSYKPWWALITAPLSAVLSPAIRFIYRRL